VPAPEGGVQGQWREVGLGFEACVKADSLGAWARALERDTAAKTASRNRPYDGANRRAAAAKRKASRRTTRSHHENGMDPQRLRRLLRRPCFCKQRCYTKVNFNQAHLFLSKYWERQKRDRDSLLSLALGGDASNTRKNVWYFMSEKMSLNCLASLLGHHKRKLQRAAAGDVVFDQRAGRRIDPAMQARIDSFFMTLYLSVAEPLPTKSPAQFPRSVGGGAASVTLQLRGKRTHHCHICWCMSGSCIAADGLAPGPWRRTPIAKRTSSRRGRTLRTPRKSGLPLVRRTLPSTRWCLASWQYVGSLLGLLHFGIRSTLGYQQSRAAERHRASHANRQQTHFSASALIS